MPLKKIFCDESCHLQKDGADVMVLGAICCDADKAQAVTRHIKWLRYEHNYQNELKWTKLVRKQFPFYKALIDLMLDDPEICFKATVVQHKERLDHAFFNEGSHNTFYYKMFYYTLRDFLCQRDQYRIYLDYMDTLGGAKTAKLCDVLHSEGRQEIDIHAYIVQSYESQLIQLCDLIIGAVAYRNRNDIEKTSVIKNQLVEYIEYKLGHGLDYGTPPWETNFNIFRFLPNWQRG
ncbi:DUF3800 domain-containing protein [Vibrio sp. JC009]|uniref:DUF3800 domain-containing protein n=1 Tax=Vibrio sp. JC009 TaxID=2912314 RepID=UPI0023AF27C3|nr:DUF3800 domain-containing protein [Vibrio sp. JC009]WED22659.1 DUF3800 domain-containing protein [Vibrio sp. JC009]